MTCENIDQNTLNLKKIRTILNSNNPIIPDCFFTIPLIFTRHSPFDPPSKTEDEYYRQKVKWQLRNRPHFRSSYNENKPQIEKVDDPILNALHSAVNKKNYGRNFQRELIYQQDLDARKKGKKPGWGKYGNLTREQLVNSPSWLAAIEKFINRQLAKAEEQDKLPRQTTFMFQLFKPNLTISKKDIPPK